MDHLWRVCPTTSKRVVTSDGLVQRHVMTSLLISTPKLWPVQLFFQLQEPPSASAAPHLFELAMRLRDVGRDSEGWSQATVEVHFMENYQT